MITCTIYNRYQTQTLNGCPTFSYKKQLFVRASVHVTNTWLHNSSTVIHSVPPSFHWLFYPALELIIFATCATAEMCTAAADICKPVLCNKQFGKMHSLSSILTLLLVFLTIVAWKKGPSPTVLRGGQRLWKWREGFWAKPFKKRSLSMWRNALEIRRASYKRAVNTPWMPSNPTQD